MKRPAISPQSVCKHHALAAYTGRFEENLPKNVKKHSLDCAIELAEIGKRKRNGADRRRILAARIFMLNLENEMAAELIEVVEKAVPSIIPEAEAIVEPMQLKSAKAKPSKTTYGLDSAASLLASFSDPDAGEDTKADLGMGRDGGNQGASFGVQDSTGAKGIDASMGGGLSSVSEFGEMDSVSGRAGDLSMGDDGSFESRKEDRFIPDFEVSRAKRSSPQLLMPDDVEPEEKVYRPKSARFENQPSLDGIMNMMFSKSEKKDADPEIIVETQQTDPSEPVAPALVDPQNDIGVESKIDDEATAQRDEPLEMPAPKPRKPRAPRAKKKNSPAADANPLPEISEAPIETETTGFAPQSQEPTIAPQGETVDFVPTVIAEPDKAENDPAVGNDTNDQPAAKPKKKKKGGIQLTPIENFDFSSLSSFGDGD